MNRTERIKTLKSRLNNNILVLDGATGTSIQKMNLSPHDFGSEDLEGCNEALVINNPGVITKVHNDFLEAGADIIETNTFGATPIVLEEYQLTEKCYQINFEGAKLARQCADTFSCPEKPRFVAGSMGPTTKAITVTGGVTFEQLVDNFYQQAKGLYDGDIDYFLIETCQDTRNIKAAVIAVQNLLKEKNDNIPIAISGTIEASGTMLAGQDVEALTTSLEHLDLLYLGINCATGPSHMADDIRTLAGLAQTRIACVPNAGLPDEDGKYLETPKMVAQVLERFVDNGWINFLGGCCGTTPAHINAMSEMVKNKTPRQLSRKNTAYLSGIEAIEISPEMRPILVGERTNVIGSKKFRRLITEKKFDEAAEIAKNQVKKGAQVIDVCLANPDSDELEDMTLFLEKVIQKIKVPLMIDSTDKSVIEKALTYSQGKAIINSINLEGNGTHFKTVAALAKKYGAAVVVGTIDSEMAVSKERKLEVATIEYKILKEEFNFQDQDIFFDPLVFPCATGDEKYVGSAVETIEGIRLIKEKFPNVKSAIGVSNVSFGLPPAGREVLNSVFLYHCVQAGLDLAIVNTQKVKRHASLTPEEIKLSEDLLWNKTDDAIADFANFFRDKKPSVTTSNNNLSPEEKISNHIIEGTKTNIERDLDLLLGTMPPLDIVNGPLMDGMKKVGTLFNSNELIVAEVLQSAESMKTAVNYLQQFMGSSTSKAKAKFMIATVKGDVHDIGKNLVDIILSNNGYEVINLGIKITSEQLIEAINKHKPDILGLSGLLVKSAQQMIATAEDLNKSGIHVPMMVGGAALSSGFVSKKIAPVYQPAPVFYAKDAMASLGLSENILKGDFENTNISNDNDKKEKTPIPDRPEIYIRNDFSSPVAPDYQKHIIKNTPIEQIFKYINPKMLLGKHLGSKGALIDLYTEGKIRALKEDPQGEKLLELIEKVEEVKNEYGKSLLVPQAVYQFFKCRPNGDFIVLIDEAQKEYPIPFPRQSGQNGICLSDFVLPNDNLALLVVTVGKGVKDQVEQLKLNDQYLKSHILGSLAIESAEGYAELLHQQIRRMWNQADHNTVSMKDLFAAKYSGKRYSFGYPACPDLNNQTIIFDLLQPQKNIGVQLTDGMMMNPEASISALVLHHPDAKYFAV